MWNGGGGGGKIAALFGAVGWTALALLVSGCAGTEDVRSAEEFMSPYSRAEYVRAAALIGGPGGLDYDRENLLLSLHAGSALRAAGSFEGSQTAYDRAESRLLWKSDEIASVGDLLDAGLTVVASDLALPYRGNIYDGVLLNTLKAMNALGLGDEARARVEFNRADQRQQNAVEQLRAKVAALGSESAGAEGAQNREIAQRTRDEALKPDSELAKRLAAVRPELEPYRDLRNPFTDWLHGLFRLATGEANRASDLFRNAAVLEGERNSYVLEDLRIAEETARSTAPAAGRVWIVHEDGIGPRLEEFRIDLPVPLPNGRAIYAGVALPEFVEGADGVGVLEATAGGEAYATELLLSVDRYAHTEFDAGRDAIVGKAIAGAVLKVIAQVAARQAAEESGSGLVGSVLALAAPAVAAATTRADTRMWNALPRSIGVASLPRPVSGSVRIAAAGSGRLGADVALPDSRFAVVWVKTVAAGAPPAIHVAALGNSPVAAAREAGAVRVAAR